MTELHLLKVPTELEAQYQALLKMFTAITQREPTVDDKNAVRVDLGLPLWRSRGSRDTLTDHSASLVGIALIEANDDAGEGAITTLTMNH